MFWDASLDVLIHLVQPRKSDTQVDIGQRIRGKNCGHKESRVQCFTASHAQLATNDIKISVEVRTTGVKISNSIMLNPQSIQP